MAHYNTPVTIEQIDPYGNLFQVLPGSSLISFYNSIQQNVTPPTTTPTDFPRNTSLPQQSFQQLPQAGPSQYHSMNMSMPQFQGHSDMIMTQSTAVPQSPPPDAMGHPLILQKLTWKQRRRNDTGILRRRVSPAKSIYWGSVSHQYAS
jgi:hypothetical protein